MVNTIHLIDYLISFTKYGEKFLGRFYFDMETYEYIGFLSLETGRDIEIWRSDKTEWTNKPTMVEILSVFHSGIIDDSDGIYFRQEVWNVIGTGD